MELLCVLGGIIVSIVFGLLGLIISLIFAAIKEKRTSEYKELTIKNQTKIE